MTTRPRCTNGSRWPSGRCSSIPSAGWSGTDGRSRTGWFGSASRRRVVLQRRVSAGSRPAGDEESHEVEKVPIKRALVSAYDKTGLAELARALAAAGVQIVSTGSTAAAIAAAGAPVTRVEEVTGFPECLDGRVKTLHPAIHAGLLADPGQAAHREQLDDLGIAPFELLVSSLYPFEETVASGAGPAESVEQIDIGGPAMVRAAAKNHARV